MSKLRQSATPTARIWRYMNTVYGSYAVSSLQGPGARGMSLLETSSYKNVLKQYVIRKLINASSLASSMYTLYICTTRKCSS